MKTFGLIVDDTPERDVPTDGSPVEPPAIEPPAPPVTE